MPHARQYTRTAPEASAGTHLDSDLDLLFAWDLTHEAGGQGAGVSAHGRATLVGTTDSQTLTNKTITSPTINTPTINTPSMVGDITTDGGEITNFATKYEAFAASATAAVTTVICGVTSTAADRTVTLPSVEIAKPGRTWFVKDESGACGNAFHIIVATEGAETIDGQASVSIDENYGTLKLYSNGTNLFILND